MSQKDFFQKLRDELHGHPLRDRFLEELEDHAEDLEDQEKLGSEEWERRMGEPTSIKQNFTSIMRSEKELVFWIVAIIIILLIVFLGVSFNPQS